MKSISILCICFFTFNLITSCSEAKKEEIEAKEKKSEALYIDNEKLLLRNIESALKIPANESYSYEIYSAYLNGDDSLDFVVSVNLKDRAIEEAIKSNNTAKRAEVGYLGNYNYLFSMDGASKKVSSPTIVASSPLAELKVTFENIRSEAYQDVMVDYRVLDGGYRRYYTMINGSLLTIMEHPLFKGLATDTASAFTVRFEDGTYSLAKDIVIYKAKIEKVKHSSSLDLYTIEPVIKPTEIVDHRWYFNDQKMKYFTMKD